MNHYKIAFFDIDGTLIDPKISGKTMFDQVPESTKEAIYRLKEANIMPVIATGRWKGVVSEFAASLEINTLITSNGQEITSDGYSIYQNFIPQNQVDELSDKLTKHEIAVLYDTQTGLYSYKNQKEAIDHTIENKTEKQEMYPEKVFQMLVQTDNQKLIKSFTKDLKVVKVIPGALDVFPKNVSKAAGVNFILNKMNFKPEEALAFGDAENDIEMFQSVGMPVAMGNAVPKVKKVSHYVTRDVDEDGIYHACKKLALF